VPVARLWTPRRVRHLGLTVSDHPCALCRACVTLLPDLRRRLSLSDQVLTRRNVTVRARRVRLRQPNTQRRHWNVRLAREQARKNLQLLDVRTLVTLRELLNISARVSGILIIRDRVNPVHDHLPRTLLERRL